MILDSGTNLSSVGHLMRTIDSAKIPPQSSQSMGGTNSIRGLFQFNRQLTLINNQFPLATRIGVIILYHYRNLNRYYTEFRKS